MKRKDFTNLNYLETVDAIDEIIYEAVKNDLVALEDYYEDPKSGHEYFVLKLFNKEYMELDDIDKIPLYNDWEKERKGVKLVKKIRIDLSEAGWYYVRNDMFDGEILYLHDKDPDAFHDIMMKSGEKGHPLLSYKYQPFPKVSLDVTDLKK